MGPFGSIVENYSTSSTVPSCPPAVGDSEDDIRSMKQFVERYLQTRGFQVTTRNARIVVAALATAAGTTDWAVLEQHIDGRLDRERLRPAA